MMFRDSFFYKSQIFLFILLLIYTPFHINSNKSFIYNPTLHRTLFEELRKQHKLLENSDVGKILKKQITRLESLSLINPTHFYQELNQLKDDYQNFMNSDDYQSHLHDISKALNDFVEYYDSLSLSRKRKIDAYISKLDIVSVNAYKQLISNRYILNVNNHNITNLIESIPHMLTDFAGHHKAPKIHESYRVNDKFRNFLKELEDKYKPNSAKNMTYLEKKKYLEELQKTITQDHNNKFTSFLQEYFQEAVLDNDYLKEKYTSLNMRKIQEGAKRDNLDISELKKEYMRKISKRNRFKSSISQEPSKPKNITKEKEEKKKKEEMKKKLEKKQKEVASKMKGIIAKIKAEKKKKPMKKIVVKGSCAEREKLIKEKIKQKEQAAKDKAAEDEKKTEPEDEDKEAANKAGGFMAIVMGLVSKTLPFNILKVCIPPVGLTLDCCPEAMAFPMQMYNVLQISNKVPEFLLAAKGYPGWLFLNKKVDIEEAPYYICAQSYLSLYESKLFPKCNPLSLQLTNPLVIAGIMPGDLPICMASCIASAATCMVTFDKFAPCADLFSPYTAMQSASNPTLALTLVNALGNCTYIPFLVRWDKVPKWEPEGEKPKSEIPKSKKSKKGKSKDGNEGEKDEEKECPEPENKDDDGPIREPTPITQTPIPGVSDEDEKTIEIFIHRWKPQLTSIKSHDGTTDITENYDTFIDDLFPIHSKLISIS